MNTLDVKNNLPDNNLSKVLSIISNKTGITKKEDILSLIDKNLLIELSEMGDKLEKLFENLDRIRKKISIYIIVFIICFLTFIEVIFYNNTTYLLLSLFICSISFLLVEREKKKISQIKSKIEDLKNDMDKKTSDIVTQILEI